MGLRVVLKRKMIGRAYLHLFCVPPESKKIRNLGLSCRILLQPRAPSSIAAIYPLFEVSVARHTSYLPLLSRRTLYKIGSTNPTSSTRVRSGSNEFPDPCCHRRSNQNKGPTTNRPCQPLHRLACGTLVMVELAGSGLAGVRHLRGERGELRRPRTTTAVRPRAFNSGDCSHASNTPTTTGGPLPRAPRVSPRQRRRIEDTHAYLCARVDPVMGSLILALMEDRPGDIHDAALEHLLSKRQGQDECATEKMRTTSVNRSSDKALPSGEEGEAIAQQRRLTRRQDRLFMAREIGPLVTELIRRTLHYMPTDVESFLIEQLQGGVTSGGTAAREKDVNNRRPYPPPEGMYPPDSSSGERRGSQRNNACSNRQNRPTRPSTARSRLQQAQSLDLHVQQTSPPLSGRTMEARRSPSPPRGPQNGGLSDEEDGICDQDRGRAPLPSRGSDGRAGVAGVKESQNKPWDVEVSIV